MGNILNSVKIIDIKHLSDNNFVSPQIYCGVPKYFCLLRNLL